MISIEYHEEHVGHGDRLVLGKDASGGRVQVIDVRPIGDELRIQYVVIRGER